MMWPDHVHTSSRKKVSIVSHSKDFILSNRAVVCVNHFSDFFLIRGDRMGGKYECRAHNICKVTDVFGFPFNEIEEAGFPRKGGINQGGE